MGTLSIGKQGEATNDIDTGPAARKAGVDGILRTPAAIPAIPLYGLVPTSRWSSGSATSFISNYSRTLQPQNSDDIYVRIAPGLKQTAKALGEYQDCVKKNPRLSEFNRES